MNSRGEVTITSQQFLDYTCSMLRQLESMADGRGHPVLAHLLDLARREAFFRLQAAKGLDRDGSVKSDFQMRI